MAKKKVDEREQARQERVSETVSKTDQFFRENKKTIYGILIALLIIGLAIVGYYKLVYQPKAKEAARQMDDNFSNIFNATYMLKAGVVCEQLGDNAKALSYYKAIKDKYPQSMEGYDIDKYISRIESQQ